MPFAYPRTIRFADTDAAGVAFFANYLAICHEAYEEALLASGIELQSFFADRGVIVPIARSEAEYLRPLKAGDRLRVEVSPAALGENSFEVRYLMTRLGPSEKAAGRVRTEHVCIDSASRRRRPLPPELARWLGLSSSGSRPR